MGVRFGQRGVPDIRMLYCRDRARAEKLRLPRLRQGVPRTVVPDHTGAAA